ncbi:MAG: hypothetical protein ACJAX4_002119 [Clostridium sp.]|jgi:hypothetical protein
MGKLYLTNPYNKKILMSYTIFIWYNNITKVYRKKQKNKKTKESR